MTQLHPFDVPRELVANADARGQRPRALPVVLIAAAALVIGGAGSFGLEIGLAAAILIGAGAAVTIRPATLVPILAASIYLEALTFGGVTISRLLAPVAILVVLVEVLRRGGGLAWRGPLPFVSLYALWALASGLWTVNLASTRISLASLAIALAYMAAFAVLIRDERHLRMTIYCLAFAAMSVGAFSTIAFLGAGDSGPLESSRSEGGVGDPNFFANLLIATLPLILVIAAEVRGRALKAVLLVSALVTIGGVVTSLSRGGLLALVAVALILPLLPARALFPSRRAKALVMLALACGAVALAATPQVRDDVTTRVGSILGATSGEDSDSDGSGRGLIWAAARLSVSERPILGLGAGAFPDRSNALIMRTPNIDLTNFELRESGVQTHSAFLGTAAELGIVGMALFLLLIASTLLHLVRTARRARAAGALFLGRVAGALGLSLIGWSVSSLFISSETGRTLWMIIGLSLALPKLVALRERDGVAGVGSARARG